MAIGKMTHYSAFLSDLHVIVKISMKIERGQMKMSKSNRDQTTTAACVLPSLSPLSAAPRGQRVTGQSLSGDRRGVHVLF